MRQRNIKDLDKKIEMNSSRLVSDPKEMKGRWRELFGNDNPIYLEIGSGKGRFIMKHAIFQKDVNFIAVEGQANVALRICEKAQEAGIPNIRIFIEYIHDINDYFDKGELDGLYLNFSDPWPKARHAKRRLTYYRNLLSFMGVMKEDAPIEFKTDNDGLFEFSLEQIETLGCEVLEMTSDLHADNNCYDSRNYVTEYEERFTDSGKNINYIKFRNTLKNQQEETK